MLNRVSINALLRSVIGLLAAGMVVMFALGAWDSWSRLKSASAIAKSADASGYLFAALHNLRSDRIFTVRGLDSDKDRAFSAELLSFRNIVTNALQNAVPRLQAIDFPAGDTSVADVDRGLQKLISLHQQANAAISLPKAQRPAGLSADYMKSLTALMETVEKASAKLAQMVQLQDAFIDQAFQLKQLAMVVRNGAGDSAAFVTKAFAAPLPPDVMQSYTGHWSRAKTAFAMIEEFAAGLPLPARFNDAVTTARKEVFESDYSARQLAILKANLAGQKLPIDDVSWDPIPIKMHMMLVSIATSALDGAKGYAETLRADAQRNLIILLVLLALALAVSVTMMIVITRRVIGPMQAIKGIMVNIASGDFTASLPQSARQDEVGQIITSVNSMVEQIRSSIGGIKMSAREVTNASAEISTSTTDLSQRTEEQAASLEQTSASMEEISSTVKKNAENARHASASANSTKTVADRGGAVVGQAVKAMAKIEESSRKISDIIGVIDEIARQTNLLALNAAVEAARAGEAGRGFAVVASEVRSLAQRSSQAAKDIKDLITNSNGQVQDGVDLVNRAGIALNEIVESISSVASIVADIANASSEQATGIDEINRALTQMDDVTQQNSALVEENAATAKTLEHQAQAMDEQVAFFQIDDADDNGRVATPSSRPLPSKGARAPHLRSAA